MVLSRAIDAAERDLVQRGEANFHVSGAGHEASAALARHLRADDWLSLHYRDKALMLARGMTPESLMHGLLATAQSQSRGRQMSAHTCAPELRILSLAGPVGNNALHAVGIADEERRCARETVVVCILGDGTSQQGEVLEAIAEADRERLAVLFVVEDNGLAISTHTSGRTFYRGSAGPRTEFLGVPVVHLDGRDVLGCDSAFGALVPHVRAGAPMIAILAVERLSDHTNTDDERVYRDMAEIERGRREGDPLTRLEARLVEMGIPLDLIAREWSRARERVNSAVAEALAAPAPEPCATARAPLRAPAPLPAATVLASAGERLTMLTAMRAVLEGHLADDQRVTLYGQDIEDPKGDVFGLTRGLSTSYPGRVRNAPLSESTIVGACVGRALAGGRPVALLQFADFLPLAFNQIAAELGSMWWRTDGGYEAPVVVMAPCGAYRPGLGPFHAQTLEATLAHVPGLDVVMPSSAADAAGLLHAALTGGRPTVFLYPKTCLNDPSLAVEPDGVIGVPPGVARRLRGGTDLTIVSWGSTIRLCAEAAGELASAGVECDLLDLRSVSPWDEAAVVASVARTRRLIVVHEDNRTCGVGAEVVATVAERVAGEVSVRRVTRSDVHVPFHFPSQLAVLPSLRGLLEAASELCELELTWHAIEPESEALIPVRAAGTSPADQVVTVIEWLVGLGDRVEAGDVLAECEADKATFELRSPAAGHVETLLAPGHPVPVGEGLAILRVDADQRAPAIGPAAMRPVLRRIIRSHQVARRPPGPRIVARPVGITAIAAASGGRVVSNEELVARWPERSAAGIERLTGIARRSHLAPGETILNLAVHAARQALDREGLTLGDLEGLVVATGTPPALSPSLACLIAGSLGGGEPGPPAFDLSAACAGYLYALRSAHDLLQHRPDGAVLVVTAEAMSQFLDPEDFATAVLFGDAATATVVLGPERAQATGALLSRPLLATIGEDGSALSHGIGGTSRLRMDGPRVYAAAVREMSRILEQACGDVGMAAADLDLIVPHQANARILSAVADRCGIPRERVVVALADSGNTSSSSIPLALAPMLAGGSLAGRVGLVAFGAGFTSGAALLEIT